MRHSSTPPLVETAWLFKHLLDKNVRIVDARWRGDGSGYQRYQDGHIPGAVHVDWQHDLSYQEGSIRYQLLPPNGFAEVMSRMGIGNQTIVVAYADLDHSGAARLWWALHYYGHTKVAVLNGGINKWLADGYPLVSNEMNHFPAPFTPQVHHPLRTDAEEIRKALNDPHTQTRLVDTRPAEQYEGLAVWTPEGSLYLPSEQDSILVNEHLMRGGHIPGAVSMVSSSNLRPNNWTYLAPEQIRKRAEALGIYPKHRVITYCGSGISASLGLFALHLAGYPDVALYDASWEEWGTNPKLPIE